MQTAASGIQTFIGRKGTRTYAQDANGAKTLVQVMDEEKHTLPGGDSKVVRATSNPDANGRLQLVQRQIEETKKISQDVEETKATVMIPSINGGLAPARNVEERRTRSADNTVASQKTTLQPGGSRGAWVHLRCFRFDVLVRFERPVHSTALDRTLVRGITRYPMFRDID